MPISPIQLKCGEQDARSDELPPIFDLSVQADSLKCGTLQSQRRLLSQVCPQICQTDLFDRISRVCPVLAGGALVESSPKSTLRSVGILARSRPDACPTATELGMQLLNWGDALPEPDLPAANLSAATALPSTRDQTARQLIVNLLIAEQRKVQAIGSPESL